MKSPPSTSELPHRPPLVANAPADPTITTSPSSPSHSRTRRRLLDRKPRPLHPTSPQNAKSCTTTAKRKLASTDLDPAAGDETRRGRSITRSLSPIDAANTTHRRRRRRSVSPSRGSKGSRSRVLEEDENSGVGMDTLRAKRRRTLDVGRGDDGDAIIPATENPSRNESAVAVAETNMKHTHTAPDKERSRSRLRARYRRMSEKASAELRSAILSSDPPPPPLDGRDADESSAAAAAVFDDDDDDDEDNTNSDPVASSSSSAEKENTVQDSSDQGFRGWGNVSREEWGVGMRNREEVAGRGAEGKGWLRGRRRSSSEA